MCWLAGRLSGEALLSNARCLLRLLGKQLREDKVEKIEKMLPLLRREANRQRPPAQRAAEPVRLQTLRRITVRAEERGLTRQEQQALDILTIAFVTVSRVGEVAALEVKDVSQDGHAAVVRPKTGARTWKKLVKKVANSGRLRAADKLADYRREAVKQGRERLFVGTRGKPLTTSLITARLKRLGKRLGCETRLTAHSARKGAAVEAVLAGTPLPVLQALGGWSDINSLQAYVGEAIRRTVSLFEVLRARSGRVRSKGKHRKQGWMKGAMYN